MPNRKKTGLRPVCMLSCSQSWLACTISNPVLQLSHWHFNDQYLLWAVIQFCKYNTQFFIVTFSVTLETVPNWSFHCFLFTAALLYGCFLVCETVLIDFFYSSPSYVQLQCPWAWTSTIGPEMLLCTVAVCIEAFYTEEVNEKWSKNIAIEHYNTDNVAMEVPILSAKYKRIHTRQHSSELAVLTFMNSLLSLSSFPVWAVCIVRENGMQKLCLLS